MIEVEGDTAGAVIRALEASYPALRGWIIDEQGALRRHVKVFYAGARRFARCTDRPRRRTAHRRRHLWRMRHDRVARRHEERPVRPAPRARQGRSRSPRALSPARSWSSPCAIPAAAAISRASRTASSARISSTPTTPAAKWEQAEGPAFPATANAAVERIWVIEPGVADGEVWCGVAPAALFRSGDGGKSWTLVQGLWDVPERQHWNPGAGGHVSQLDLPLARRCETPGGQHLGRRRLADRRRRQQLAAGRQGPGAALPAGGGAPRHARALRAPHRARAAPALHALHAVPRRRLSLRRRRRDLGRHRHRIAGLPSDFGFPLAIDPDDPDRAFVIPLVGGCGPRDAGRPRYASTRRAIEAPVGARSRKACRRSQAYLTVLRQAFCSDGGNPLGLYFGAQSGRGVRLGQRRPHLVDARGPPAAGCCRCGAPEADEGESRR